MAGNALSPSPSYQDYVVSTMKADNSSSGNSTQGSCPSNSTDIDWYYCNEYVDFSQISAVHSIIIFLYAVVMAVGIGGNSMVIAVVIRHRHMRTPTNFYIVSLAFSDLFLTAFALPLKLVELSADVEKSIHSPTMCSVLGFIIPMFVFTSVWTLTAISIDRYLVIVHPLRSRNFNTKSRAIRVISIVWIMPFFVLAPYFLPHQVYAYYTYSDYGTIRRELCTEDFFNLISPTFAMAYAMLLLLVLYFIPIMVLCFTCGSIALRLLGVTDAQTIIKSSLRKEEAGRRKVAKMVLIVVLAFAICWTPFFSSQIISYYSKILKESNYFFILLLIHLFSFSNSLMNPIIYFLMSQAFRRGFASILACIFPCFKSMLIQERRVITGVSTSEVGDNGRTDFAGSRKRGHGGRGMSWRETTQYSAISEAPEEIDMTKMSSGNQDHSSNGKGLTKIEEVGDGKSDARIEEEEYLMSYNLSNDCSKQSDTTRNRNQIGNSHNNFSDVDLNSGLDHSNMDPEGKQRRKCDANANKPPPEVIVNSYS